MEELFKVIEEKIRRSGYEGPVNGEEIYYDLCDEIEDKENGSYLVMLKQEGDVFYECRVDVMEQNFDLPSMDIHTPTKVYHVNFDE